MRRYVWVLGWGRKGSKAAETQHNRVFERKQGSCQVSHGFTREGTKDRNNFRGGKLMFVGMKTEGRIRLDLKILSCTKLYSDRVVKIRNGICCRRL